jgi:hypothetical protein
MKLCLLIWTDRKKWLLELQDILYLDVARGLLAKHTIWELLLCFNTKKYCLLILLLFRVLTVSCTILYPQGQLIIFVVHALLNWIYFTILNRCKVTRLQNTLIVLRIRIRNRIFMCLTKNLNNNMWQHYLINIFYTNT